MPSSIRMPPMPWKVKAKGKSSAKPMFTLRPGMQPKAIPTSTPITSPNRFKGTMIIFNALMISAIAIPS